MGTKKVAIACQGGGTHAAFTWGVLTEILRMKKQPGRSRISLPSAAPRQGRSARWRRGTALSRIPPIRNAARSTRRRTPGFSVDHLCRDDPGRARTQSDGRLPLALEIEGRTVSGVHPYDVSGNLGLAGLSMMGARREYLEFPALLRSLCPHFETVDSPRVAKADLRIPRRGHRGSQRQLRGLQFRQEPRKQGAAYHVICPEGLSLWLRHCPHLVTNGPLEPVFSPPPTAAEATA